MPYKSSGGLSLATIGKVDKSSKGKKPKKVKKGRGRK